MYRKLAPTWRMVRDGLAATEYEAAYAAILSGLDARTVWHELHELAGGHEPVLLCFERPPFSPSNWCHRRLVAAWFAQELGHEVEELGYGMIPIRGATPVAPTGASAAGQIEARTGVAW